MNSDAKKAVVKFSACGLIAGFTVIAIVAGDGGGLFRPVLYTVAVGVCCGLVWPTQDQGDALMEWIKGGRR